MTGVYKLTDFGVRRLADMTDIPPDVSNTDWARYQAWLAKGNTPDPSDPDPPPDAPDVQLRTNKLIFAVALYLGNLQGQTPAQVLAGVKAVYQAIT
jgi:hypothetical protein